MGLHAINERYLLSWDTANKAEEHNDYSACITILFNRQKKSYVLESYREKLEFPSLIRKVKEKYELVKNKYKCPIKLFIEDNGSGTQLIQTLEAEYNIPSQAIKPEYDKATRLQSVSHFMENGSCLFPNNEPHWWHNFLHELLRFPKAKHDDQCDALSQTLGNKPEIARAPCFLRGRRKRIDLYRALGVVRGEFQLL